MRKSRRFGHGSGTTTSKRMRQPGGLTSVPKKRCGNTEKGRLAGCEWTRRNGRIRPVRPFLTETTKLSCNLLMVLGAGLEPARLAAKASKAFVSAIPPPERGTRFGRCRCPAQAPSEAARRGIYTEGQSKDEPRADHSLRLKTTVASGYIFFGPPPPQNPCRLKPARFSPARDSNLTPPAPAPLGRNRPALRCPPR